MDEIIYGIFKVQYDFAMEVWFSIFPFQHKFCKELKKKHSLKMFAANI